MHYATFPGFGTLVRWSGIRAMRTGARHWLALPGPLEPPLRVPSGRAACVRGCFLPSNKLCDLVFHSDIYNSYAIFKIKLKFRFL